MKINKKIWIILYPIIIILISIIVIFILKLFKNPNITDNNIPNQPVYSDKALSVLKELSSYENISNREYSKTIESLLESEMFNEDYIEEYYQIDYVDISNFANYLNILLNKNYHSEEINFIFKNFSNNIDILLDMDYIDILKYKDISNFDITNFERYLSYQDKNTNYDIKTVVTYVNIGLDLQGYSKYQEYTVEEAENDLTILVNKYHKLPDNYEPSDLVSLSYNSTYKLRKEAAEAFEKLTSAGILENVYFYPFSPYRSFETQSVLYNRYKARDGEAKADTYSARPGFSEHQLGLAVDVRSPNLNDNITPETYEWMLNNSYKYGFIVRYPKGKQFITQYMEEPWHIRYLGIDLATKVHDSGLTYDEYYDLYLETH